MNIEKIKNRMLNLKNSQIFICLIFVPVVTDKFLVKNSLIS